MAVPRHDWYAAQWVKRLGKKQADVVRALDWNKAKVSLTFRGEQPFTRDDLNELADFLHIEPFELLMSPDRAMSLRQLRASAEQIVTLAHETPPDLLANDLADQRYKRKKAHGTGSDGAPRRGAA